MRKYAMRVLGGTVKPKLVVDEYVFSRLTRDDAVI